MLVQGFTGYPDGCTIADDDSIFIAFWNGGCVGRYNPNTGTLIKKYVRVFEPRFSCLGAFPHTKVCPLGARLATWHAMRVVLRARYMIPGATQVTSCAFGGPKLDQLYITTAAAGISEDKLVPGAKQENAGHLFRLDLSAEGVKGVPAYSYAM